MTDRKKDYVALLRAACDAGGWHALLGALGDGRTSPGEIEDQMVKAAIACMGRQKGGPEAAIAMLACEIAVSKGGVGTLLEAADVLDRLARRIVERSAPAQGGDA